MSAARLALAAALAAVCTAGPGAALAGTDGRAHGPLAQVAAKPNELSAARPLDTPHGGTIERYRQYSGGLPVIGAEAVVADPASGPAQLVNDTTVSGLGDPGPVNVSRTDAIAIAEEAAGVARRRAPAHAELGVDPRSGAAIWDVVVPSSEPLGDFAVEVGAADGDAGRVRDLLRYATGAAAVFVPNAVVANGSKAGLADNKDKDSTLLTGLRAPVALERITSPDGCLVGTYVDARLGAGKKARPVCAPNADFTGVTRAADEFEAVMSYYHVDRTRAYVDSLGLTEPLRSQPQVVEANSLPDDNSFFSPGSRKINFGTGGVDDGEDADVIVHEYGHSLQDQAVNFFGEKLEGASMGEGFGDYMAAVMSFQTTGGSPFDPCMFEWDATSYVQGSCARRADKALTKPKARGKCGGDPHCIGLAWSGALWKLRGELGFDGNAQSVMDRVVLESHFLLSRGANFKAGAKALLAGDKLLYAGAHVAAIEAEMVGRGFCKKSGC